MYLKIHEIQIEFGTNSEDTLLRELEVDVEHWRSTANEDVLLTVFSIFGNFPPLRADWIMNQIFSARKLTERIPLSANFTS